MNNIANSKLESFFNSNRLIKKASLGHFGDVISEDDLKAVSEMVFNMVTLPKYEKIKSQLRSANGVVNFVTYDEFEPLVEAIFRTSLPPNANEIYHMGQGFSLPEDYFVNAKNIFGPQGQDPSQRLERVLKGSEKKISTQWLKDNGLDPTDPRTSTSYDMVFGTAGEELKTKIKAYEEAMSTLARSSLKSEINDLFKKIEKHIQNKNSILEIEKFNEGKPANLRKPFPRVLSKDAYDNMKKQLRKKRALYIKAIETLNDKEEFSALDISNLAPDMFSISGEKNNDGFMSWSPEGVISSICEDLFNLDSEDELHSTPKDTQIITAMTLLIQNLMDYRTTDPDLINKRKKIIDFIGVKEEGNKFALKDPTRTVQEFGMNIGTFTRITSEFISRANQHGKIMILTDVDNSALTAPQSSIGEQTRGLKLTGLQVFQDFAASNNSNMVRDMQGGKKLSSGKRTIILVTDQPLSNLPMGGTTIEMDVSPVDEKEAEIIVNALIDTYVKESERAMYLKMYHDVEKKYTGDNPRQDQKEIEIYQIDDVVASAKTRLAYISPEGRKKIAQMLINTGQKQAIQKCKEFLATNVFYEKDEDGIISNITFDEDKLLDGMIEEFTKFKTKNVKGLELRRSQVKWGDYITKKGSKWGNVVGDLAFKAAQVKGIKKEIKSAQDEIIQIDYELKDSRLSPATKQAKMESRKGWEDLIKKLIIDRDGMSKDIPHFCLLRGHPGVGKSIFGDALADLLDASLFGINVGEIFDKWLGNTEKNSKALLNSVFGSRNAVFMIDELDRQIDMKGSNTSEGSGGNGHPTEKKVVKDFLDAFDLRIGELIDRGIYVIMTTNHINDVDEAFFKRTKGDSWEVEMSDNPSDYLQFLNSFMEKERNSSPTDPWIRGGGNTYEQMWDYTINYVKTNIDLQALSMDFAQKKLSFRSLSGMIRKACKKHNTFVNEFIPALSRGEPVTPKGLPLTTTNLKKAITFINDVSEGNIVDIEMDGIDDVYQQMQNQVEKLWDVSKLEETTINHPVTGKPRKGLKIPADILSVIEGKWATIAEENPQFDVSEEEIQHPTDPNIKRKQVFLQPSKPRKDIGELADSGMKEDTLDGMDRPQIEQERSQNPKPQTDKEKKEKEMEGKASSTSEYLYRFLKAKGVITSDDKVVVKKAQIETSQNEQNLVQGIQPFDSVEQHGTYYFNNGQMVIMSEGNNVPPLRFYNSKKSRN